MKKSNGQRTRVIRLVSELNFGGVETGIVIQSELIDRERFDFRVCTFWKDGTAAQSVRDLGVPVDVLGVDPSIYNPRATMALARYLRKMHPHVLHASVTEADVHAALLARLRLAGRTIVDEAGFPEAARFRRRLAFRMLNRFADDVVVVSEGLGDFMVQKEGAPREKIRFIPNCGKPEYFENPKTNFAPSTDQFRVGVVGRLVDVKNHRVLIEALAQMPSETRPQLNLFGDGPLREAIIAQAERAQVADRVFVHGFVPGSITERLREMDAFAIPSLAEGCSLALIEAMALALPVLTSRVQGNIEVVGDLGDEWLIAPNDVPGWAAALSRMQAISPEARRAHGEAGRRRAQSHYSPQAYVAALDRLYLARN